MSAVSEWIVREYFESLGFLVRQPRKFQIGARQKQPEEEVDLVVVNPLVSEQKLPNALVWGRNELKHVARAIIAVRGWHTERFSPAVLNVASEIFRLTQDTVLDDVKRTIGEGPVAKVLCLPEFPASGTLRNEAMKILREKGIDGVILFRTMLLELASFVDVNKNYEKSDLRQMLRILKSYDLLKDAQMDLFKKRRRKPGPK